LVKNRVSITRWKQRTSMSCWCNFGASKENLHFDNKQLFDEVFCDIQNNQGRGIHWTEKKKIEVMFLLLHWRQATPLEQHKARDLDMITLRNHAPWSYMTCYPWPWVSLTWLLYNLQLWRHRRWFRKFTVRFRPIRKEIVSSVYNNQS